MTKEQYEKWSAPYRRKRNGISILIGIDRAITAVVFVSYPVLLAALMLQKLYGEMLLCVVVPAVSFVLVSVFRKFYSAPRPYEILDIQPLIKKNTKGKSFPSRHVFSVFMIGMTYFYMYWPAGIAIGILGIALAYVRVVGGVHFPKDIAAGALIGILSGILYFIR
ncbi:MAG: phosphatase PAP2 family protein [Eubacterium sp.]|nr:phosphatase PAP2 family protein [Eubacterium sp.]